LNKNYDIVVVGAGHAGIEAACASAKMGLQVALVTMEKNAIGRMSCNPAVGGTAKGHLVREIDALGGVMGIIADQSGIQFRMLNRSKGPAVWSPRSQNDRKLYTEMAIKVVDSYKNITVVEGSIVEILVENKKVSAVITSENELIYCNAVIICSGTFLNGLMHTGLIAVSGGRFGEMPSTGLTECLVRLGFESGRLKTGTPPRLNKNSINWAILEVQPGDENPQPFSFRTDTSEFPYLPQVNCHITYTDASVHSILEKGFNESPMFTGLIRGIGPRYCPSIEDKIVRFKDKERHHLFLEPEGLNSDLIYLNGFSTSLPAEVQLKALHKIKGLEEVEMIRPGYAVEYDFFPPHQVDLTLETKLIAGLYFAGQINGTSGYEEAAAQGLVAGINAAAKILQMEEFVLKRSEAYIGVMIDDLVNKSTEEPYRMFTSRAEHRLLLRQDNADLRLSYYGNKYQLISNELFGQIKAKKKKIEEGRGLLETIKIPSNEINHLLVKIGESETEASEVIAKLVKRPELKLKEILQLKSENDFVLSEIKNNNYLIEQLEIELKYEGYIKRQEEVVKKVEKFETLNIPLNFNYLILNSLSTEGREKLFKVKPRSIGQASRISGVTASDISILLVYLRK